MDEFFDFNIRFEDIIQAISSRSLATSNLPGPVKDTVVAKWKESLWARDSVEPAMLRLFGHYLLDIILLMNCQFDLEFQL